VIKEIKLTEKLTKDELRSIRGGCGCGYTGKCGTLAISNLIFEGSVDCSGYVQKIPL
jgi:hypothetical protein